MYIVPAYISIEKDEIGNLCLFSTLEGTEIALEEAKYITEFWTIYNNGTEKIDTELTRFLHKSNMLIEKDKLSDTVKSVIEEVESGFFKVTIMPTEQCNFRCTYCYEQFKYGIIDDCVVNRIMEFIKHKLKYENHTEFKLEWFGGEPTLSRQGLIPSVTSSMKSLCEHSSIKFTSSITTNGYLLSRSLFLDYLHSGITNFQITIDGLRHDLTRIACDGSGTFSTIINNIKDIHDLSNDYKYNVTLRYNVLPENQDTSWYDYLGNLVKDDDRFGILIRPVSDLGGEKVKYLERYSAKDWKELLNFHIQKALAAGLKVVNLSEKRPFAKACFASFKDSYIFRANGDVVKCSSHIDDDRNIIGIVDPQKGVIINEQKNAIWSSFLPGKECYDCSDLGSCLNKNCPYLRLEHNACIYCEKAQVYCQ